MSAPTDVTSRERAVDVDSTASREASGTGNATPVQWRRPLATIALLWAATALGAVMAFVTQTLLARALGPASYGLFASSLTTVSMVAPLAGFGLSQFWLKTYGAEGWAANRWLSASAKLVIRTTLLTVAGLVLWAFAGAPNTATRLNLLILSPVVLSLLAVDLVSAKYRLEERYRRLALWQLSLHGGRLLVVLVVLGFASKAGLYVAVGYAAVSVAIVTMAAPQLRAMWRGRMELQGHGLRPPSIQTAEPPSVGDLWSRAWAFGLEAALYPIFFQINTVLVKYLGSDVQAGMFGLAQAVITAVYLLPATIYQKFLLSKLHRWVVFEPPRFWVVYRRGNVAMLAAGAFVGLLLAVLAQWFVPIVFGAQYVGVVRILTVMALCVPVRFLSTALASALLNEVHMRFRVGAMAAATISTVAAAAVVIPAFGEVGAAASALAGEGVLLAAIYIGVRRYHPGARLW